MQVPQLTTVSIGIPRWALQSGEHGNGVQSWILKRCLPGQRAAASEWNKYFTEICERYGCINFQGICSNTRMRWPSFLFTLLVVGTKEYITEFHTFQRVETED